VSGATSDDELNASTRSAPQRVRSSNTLGGLGPSGATLAWERTPEAASQQRSAATGANQVPVGGSPVETGLQASVQRLLEALNEAELAGAPATELEIRQRQFD
jgi:hypothetical protein